MGRAKKKCQAAGGKNWNEAAVADDWNADYRFYHDFSTGIFIIQNIRRETMWNKVKKFLYDEQGITSVEIILILVVLIGLVLIFKEEMTEIVNNIFKTITSQSGKILK